MNWNIWQILIQEKEVKITKLHLKIIEHFQTQKDEFFEFFHE